MNQEEASDGALLERFRAAGSASDAGRRAAGTLLARYRGRVYAWCRRVIRGHEEAMDLSQVVLLKAWRALPAFDGRSQFSSWLFAIARNECLTALRPRMLRRDPDVDPGDVLVEREDPASLLESREAAESLEALVREALSPLEQEAIWLRCVEERSVDEITRILGIRTASGARGVLQGARLKLRRAMERNRTSA